MAKEYGPQSYPEEPALPYPFLPIPAASASPVGSFNASNAPAPAIYPSANAADYSKGAWADPSKPNEFVSMTPGQTSPYQTPGYAKDQANIKALSTLSPIMGGLGAGSSVQPTTDAGSAVLQTVGAGVGGAAQGALAGATLGAAGGPGGALVGAGIGGLVGLVSGGIQSYMGLRSARASKREQERVYREIIEREEMRHKEARGDQQEQLRYNRRSAALQAQWSAAQAAGQKLRSVMKDNEDLKQLFIQGGR